MTALRSVGFVLSLGVLGASASLACGAKVSAACHDATECPSGGACREGACVDAPPAAGPTCPVGESECSQRCPEQDLRRVRARLRGGTAPLERPSR